MPLFHAPRQRNARSVIQVRIARETLVSRVFAEHLQSLIRGLGGNGGRTYMRNSLESVASYIIVLSIADTFKAVDSDDIWLHGTIIDVNQCSVGTVIDSKRRKKNRPRYPQKKTVKSEHVPFCQAHRNPLSVTLPCAAFRAANFCLSESDRDVTDKSAPLVFRTIKPLP